MVAAKHVVIIIINVWEGKVAFVALPMAVFPPPLEGGTYPIFRLFMNANWPLSSFACSSLQTFYECKLVKVVADE